MQRLHVSLLVTLRNIITMICYFEGLRHHIIISAIVDPLLDLFYFLENIYFLKYIYISFLYLQKKHRMLPCNYCLK